MKRRSALKLAFWGMGAIGVVGVGRALLSASDSRPADAWMRWAPSVDLLALEPGETVRLDAGNRAWHATRLTDAAWRAVYDRDPRTLRDPAEAEPRTVRIETAEGTRRFALLAAECGSGGCILEPVGNGDWACPCDAAIFDPVGRIVGGKEPANLRLPLFVVDDGEAFLRLDQTDG